MAPAVGSTDIPSRAPGSGACDERTRAGRGSASRPCRRSRCSATGASAACLDQVLLSTESFDSAATLAPNVQLRSLDAIHLEPRGLSGDLLAVVTYDRRLADAARGLGLAVETPG